MDSNALPIAVAIVAGIILFILGFLVCYFFWIRFNPVLLKQFLESDYINFSPGAELQMVKQKAGERRKVENFFTLTSVGTLAGASAIVIVVANTYRKLTSHNSVLPSFICSAVACFIGAYQLKAIGSIVDWLMIFFNTCLLFCTAAGMQDGREWLGVETCRPSSSKVAILVV